MSKVSKRNNLSNYLLTLCAHSASTPMQDARELLAKVGELKQDTLGTALKVGGALMLAGAGRRAGWGWKNDWLGLAGAGRKLWRVNAATASPSSCHLQPCSS